MAQTTAITAAKAAEMVVTTMVVMVGRHIATAITTMTTRMKIAVKEGEETQRRMVARREQIANKRKRRRSRWVRATLPPSTVAP
jgi:hypothetical protein